MILLRKLHEAVIEPAAINNEEEGFGRNAGLRHHYYRVTIRLTDLWRGYIESPNDGLRIEGYLLNNTVLGNLDLTRSRRATGRP